MVQEPRQAESSEQAHLEVAAEVSRLLADGTMPGTDLIAEDATASGAVFGSALGDVMPLLRDRLRVLLEGAGTGMTTRESVVAPGGEVLVVSVAHDEGSAWIIAVVNEFRDGRIVHATAYQDVAEAYAAVGLPAP